MKIIIYSILAIKVLSLFIIMLVYKMYFEPSLILILCILFYLMYKLRRLIFIEYGIKKNGYVCYYNDYSTHVDNAFSGTLHGSYSYDSSVHQIDVMISDDASNQKFYSRI